MKNRIAVLSAFVAVMWSAGAYSQEKDGATVSGGADIVSGYVWRGVYQAGVSFQPTMGLSIGEFSVTAWGSVDFAATSYKEMDITLSYALGPVILSLADLYWEGNAAERTTAARNYFDFGAGSPHRIEAGASWRISPQVPITVSWYTILFGAADVNDRGKRAYSSYLEVAYPFRVKGIDMKAGLGVVPWNAVGTYGIDKDFYVQNAFISAGRMWSIGGMKTMQFGIFTSLIWNPAMEDVNFTGGLSFSM